MQKVRWNYSTDVIHLIMQIQGYFTLYNEFFSPFLHSTCSLSVKKLFLACSGGPLQFSAKPARILAYSNKFKGLVIRFLTDEEYAETD